MNKYRLILLIEFDKIVEAENTMEAKEIFSEILHSQKKNKVIRLKDRKIVGTRIMEVEK